MTGLIEKPAGDMSDRASFAGGGPLPGATAIGSPCGKCGGRERYVRGWRCVPCRRRVDRERKRERERRAEVQRCREIAAAGDRRTPEEEAADLAVELLDKWRRKGVDSAGLIEALLAFGEKRFLEGKYTRRVRPAAPPLTRPKNRHEIPPLIVRWIVARAGAFIKRGRREIPAWGSEGLARNLRNSRGIVLSGMAIRRLLREVAPELAQRRAACYRVMRRRRLSPLKR